MTPRVIVYNIFGELWDEWKKEDGVVVGEGSELEKLLHAWNVRGKIQKGASSLTE